MGVRTTPLLGTHIFRTEGWDFVCTRVKLIFHCDPKLLALGTFASLNAKDSTFASPDARIPTCRYLLR